MESDEAGEGGGVKHSRDGFADLSIEVQSVYSELGLLQENFLALFINWNIRMTPKKYSLICHTKTLNKK